MIRWPSDEWGRIFLPPTLYDVMLFHLFSCWDVLLVRIEEEN